MFKKIGLIILSALAIFVALLSFSACDPSIYDAPGGVNPFENIDLSQYLKGKNLSDFLDPETCYTQLKNDLEFMKSDAYSDADSASAQAYTILMSYGFADKSIDASDLSSAKLQTKTDLFSEIKQITVYANLFTDNNDYDWINVLSHTDNAISLCNQMIRYF